jgi:DNA-binding transcriptional LysR family regulator
MTEDLDFRLLRYIVAITEDLHFTRTAQRLFVAVPEPEARSIRRAPESAEPRSP